MPLGNSPLTWHSSRRHAQSPTMRRHERAWNTCGDFGRRSTPELIRLIGLSLSGSALSRVDNSVWSLCGRIKGLVGRRIPPYQQPMSKAHRGWTQVDGRIYSPLGWIPNSERLGLQPQTDRTRSEISRTCLELLWARALHRRGENDEAMQVLRRIPECDLRSAANDQLQRSRRSKTLASTRSN